MDYNPLGSSVHGISQTIRLKWVAISYSRGSSRPRDQTHISWVICTLDATPHASWPPGLHTCPSLFQHALFLLSLFSVSSHFPCICNNLSTCHIVSHSLACIVVFPLNNELLESREQILHTQNWLLEGKGVSILLKPLLRILLARLCFLPSPPQTLLLSLTLAALSVPQVQRTTVDPLTFLPSEHSPLIEGYLRSSTWGFCWDTLASF